MKETIYTIGFRDWKNAVRSVLLGVIALLIVRYFGGQEQMSEELRWIVSSLVAIGAVFILTFLYHLVQAPVYIKWENEKQPRITASLRSGRRQWEYEHQYLMWAELDVTNTSISQPLEDVEIKVSSIIDVLDWQDAPNNYLLCPVQQSNPMGVCWSERFASPNQLKLTIPPNSTRTALIAFSNDSNGMWTVFNTPVSPKPRHLGGARIQIEISSPDSAPYEGIFYIQCHPNYTDGTRTRFEFVEWDKWVVNHHVIVHSSVADKEVSQN